MPHLKATIFTLFIAMIIPEVAFVNYFYILC